MKRLIIDTAHPVTSYLALVDETVVATQMLDSNRPHSEVAALSLVALLESQGWQASDLEQVVVGKGPGSYTGVRVGLGLAKGLNLATGVPLIGFCSLVAYVCDREPFVAAFDARAGGAWILPSDGEPGRLSMEEMERYIDRPIVTPDGGTLRKRLGGRFDVIDGTPDINRVACLEGKVVLDGQVSPMYAKWGES